MATRQTAQSAGQAASGAPAPDVISQLIQSNPKIAAAFASVGTAGGGTTLYDNPSSYADPKALLFAGAPAPGQKPTYSQITKGWVGHNGTDPSFLIPNGDQYTTIIEPDTGRQRLAKDDPNLSLVDVGYNSQTGKWEVVGQAQVNAAGDNTTQVGDTLKAFYAMSSGELARTQRLLFAGGFYGSANLTDVPFGTADEASFAAWARAVSRAARLYGVGQKVTVDDVLAQAARAGGISGAGGASGSGGSGNKVVSLTDPASLRSTIDTTAQAILGRKATVDEERVFISLMHQLQSESQLAAQGVGTGEGNANASGTVGFDVFTAEGADPTLNKGSEGTQGPGTASSTAQRGPRPDVAMQQLADRSGATTSGQTIMAATPDAQAQAAELLRRQHPEEAGAHDVATQFDNFLRLLRGAVQ